MVPDLLLLLARGRKGTVEGMAEGGGGEGVRKVQTTFRYETKTTEFRRLKAPIYVRVHPAQTMHLPCFKPITQVVNGRLGMINWPQ